MWDWVLILSLLFTGLLLIIVEILFVPGTTLVGLCGFAFAITAIFSAYGIFGNITGHYVLGGILAVFVLSIYFAFRSEVWLRFANKGAIKAKVNEGMLDALQIGMHGKAVSDLRPIGKAEFGDVIYEVTSSASWIQAGEIIKIVKLKDFRIFVEPITVQL